jgi:type II secretory pathway pseudopilin PulG
MELLVVLVIIGLLAGLLLTTTVRSRRAARETTCINNLHQIGLAFRMFCDERGERPTEITDLVGAGYITPDVLLCPEDPTGDYGRLYCGEQIGCDRDMPFATSYVYISGERADDMYERLERLDGQGSYLVCPSHGRRHKENWGGSSIPGYYEGKVLRLGFDGSVRTGSATWERDRNLVRYPFWELFTDVAGEPPFDGRGP